MPTRSAVPPRSPAALLVGVVLIVSASCNNENKIASLLPGQVMVTLAAPPVSCTRVHATVDSMFHYDSSTIQAFERNGLCSYDIPEYNDEQELIHSNGQNHSYGPLAHAYAFESGRTITDFMSFNGLTWKLLGLVLVDAGPLPPPYQARLKLQTGLNCFYAHHSGNNPNNGWDFAVTNLAAGATCSGGVANSVKGHGEQLSTNAADYPVTARFMEGPGMEGMLGIRCGNVWCVTGANGGPPDVTPPGYGTPLSSSLKWVIEGWYDDQTLAHNPGSGLSPFKRMAIVPTDNLGSLKIADFTGVWKDVAIINVPANLPPLDKYGPPTPPATRGFSFVAGPNTIALRATPSGSGLKWEAKLTNATYPSGHVYSKPVLRTDHSSLGFPIDGTARWHWLPGDEAVWVRCDLGCCLVYGD